MLGKALASRALLINSQKLKADCAKQLKRNSGHGSWAYRCPPAMPSKFSQNLATGIGAVCWWWILYHIFTEPDHIIGEWPYVHPKTWTDEELGIPPDSFGPLKKNA